MKGLLLAGAAALAGGLAVTVVFRTGVPARRAAAMLRVFLASAAGYALAYVLTPPDLGMLPAALVEPRPALDAALGLFVHGALFFGGWLQLYNLADRGFGLHVLIAIHRAPGRGLTFEEVRAGYGGGRGMAGMVDKRLAGVLATGFVTLDGGRLRPTAKGRRAGALFGALRRFLQLDPPR